MSANPGRLPSSPGDHHMSVPSEKATPLPRSLGSDLSYSTALALLTIVAGSVLIRWPFLHVPMISDEGGYAYVAHFWSSDFELYRDMPFNRLQAIFLLYKMIFLTLGDDVFAIRLFAALYNSATLVVLFWLARQVYSDRAALASAAVFAVFSVGPSMEGFTANSEIFAQLPIVASALFAWRRQWAWAGVAAAAAVLVKPIGLSALVLTVVWAFVTGASVRGAVIAVLTFILGLLPSVLHGMWVGWEFYFDSMVTQRVLFASQGSLSFGTQIVRLASGTLMTIPSWGIPAALSVVALSRRFQTQQLFGLLWVVSALFGMAMGGFWFWHYFVQLVPPLALLAGAGALGLFRSGFRWVPTVLLVLATILFSRDVALWGSSPSEISWHLYGRSGLPGRRRGRQPYRRKHPSGRAHLCRV